MTDKEIREDAVLMLEARIKQNEFDIRYCQRNNLYVMQCWFEHQHVGLADGLRLLKEAQEKYDT